ncbi:MAG TPA: septal ring lytic transglycosylase RlpA family protein [bacterium]|nr:septal ring lytic transglycosylase RlpA family protein [bacterium]HPO11086.1 septal ring lytic transglycosylase RlpA family protein [bacterium]HQL11595.1 septal ring lytic transglycosylase RlpA family protein [bacterium]
MFFKRFKNIMRKNLNIIIIIFSFFVLYNVSFAEILPGDVMPFSDEIDVSPHGYYLGIKEGDILPFAEEKEYKLLKYGYGTYYGTTNVFQGKKTASGEIFDRNLMTCAINGVDFGTYLKVTNVANNKSVIVKVNDRMGTYHGNTIDLSVKAFEQIAKLSTGKIWVKIEKQIN